MCVADSSHSGPNWNSSVRGQGFPFNTEPFINHIDSTSMHILPMGTLARGTLHMHACLRMKCSRAFGRTVTEPGTIPEPYNLGSLFYFRIIYSKWKWQKRIQFTRYNYHSQMLIFYMDMRWFLWSFELVSVLTGHLVWPKGAKCTILPLQIYFMVALCLHTTFIPFDSFVRLWMIHCFCWLHFVGYILFTNLYHAAVYSVNLQ